MFLHVDFLNANTGEMKGGGGKGGGLNCQFCCHCNLESNSRNVEHSLYAWGDKNKFLSAFSEFLTGNCCNKRH
jgi:hypothetical protein